MIDNVSHNRPRYGKESKEDGRVKPLEQPPTDDFRKKMRDRHPKKGQENVEDSDFDQESKPSLFDLSKNTKAKRKSPAGQAMKGDNAEKSFQVGSKSDQGQEFAFYEDSEGNEVLSSTTMEKGKNFKSDPTLLTDAEMAEFPPDTGAGIKMTKESSAGGKVNPFTTDIKQPDSLQSQGLNKNKETLNLAKSTDVVAQQTADIAHLHSKRSDGFKVEEGLGIPEEADLIAKKDKSKKSLQQDLGQERGAMAAFHTDTKPADFQTADKFQTPEASRSATMRELVTQIVDKIQVMRKGNETETTITLRHPPILEGATITLATTDDAKKEFNISFGNLSTKAKVFLDRQLRENPLSESLERKGIIVHTVTTQTTQSETIGTDAGQSFRDRQEQQQQQQQQQRQRQMFQEDEEAP